MTGSQHGAKRATTHRVERPTIGWLRDRSTRQSPDFSTAIDGAAASRAARSRATHRGRGWGDRHPSRPSRASSTVWFANPTTSPRSIANSAGLTTVNLDSASTIRNTSASERPTASAAGRPVKRSAVTLIAVITPAASVAITPSPIECNVIARRSSLDRSCSSARRRCVML